MILQHENLLSLHKHSSNLTDEQFLSQIIFAVDLLTNASPKQFIGIKNIFSEIIYYSNAFANFLGLSQEQIIGKKTIVELYKGSEIENQIIHEDQQVITERSQLRILKINKMEETFKPYVCIKSALINPTTNHIVGVLLQGFEISILNLNQHLIRPQRQLTENLPNNGTLPRLSKRERQVIFFFMAQLSSQEIADILYQIEGKKVSKSTIDSIFNEQLYLKFNVVNRIALREKLSRLGYDKLIPQDILHTMSMPLDVFNVY